MTAANEVPNGKDYGGDYEYVNKPDRNVQGE